MDRKTIEKALANHEREHPQNRHLADLSVKDLNSLGTPTPSKPIAMESSYLMDGGEHNRDHYSNNFDHLLSPRDKGELDDEMLDLSEIASMLHHPEYIANQAEHESENQNLVRGIFKDLINSGRKDLLVKEVFKPLLNNLLDKLDDKNSIFKELLAPAMVNKTKHHPKKHSDNMEMMFSMPVVDGHLKGNWKKFLEDQNV